MSDKLKHSEPNQQTDAATKKEIQKHFNMFKKRFKTHSKSELISLLWNQGVDFKELQDIARELYEENKALKEASSAEENIEESI